MSQLLTPRYEPKPQAHLLPLTPSNLTKQWVTEPLASLKTLPNAFSRTQASDSQLARFDDTFRKVGSAMIATMGALSVSQGKLSRAALAEWAGFIAWYLAMAATPQIINQTLRLKTGINLNQQYIDSYRQKSALFNDPNYLPLQLLPNETIQRVGQRLGIAPSDKQRELVHERMRQISVQARTWWMLVAGPATPILSAFLAHMAEPALFRLAGQLRQPVLLQQALKAAEHPQNVYNVEQHVERWLQSATGKHSLSPLADWWIGLNTRMVNALQLNAMSLNDLKTPEQFSQKISQKLTTWAASKPEKLKQAQHWLAKEVRQLEAMALTHQQAFDKLAQPLAEQLPQQLERWSVQLKDAWANATGTLLHTQGLLNALAKGADANEIELILNATTGPQFSALMEQGFGLSGLAAKGSTAHWLDTINLMAAKQSPRAASRGAGLSAYLEQAVNSTLRRSLWRRRVLGVGGLGLLSATLLYNMLWVGRPLTKVSEKGVPS